MGLHKDVEALLKKLEEEGVIIVLQDKVYI
jgi:hypothetical protein